MYASICIYQSSVNVNINEYNECKLMVCFCSAVSCKCAELQTGSGLCGSLFFMLLNKIVDIFGNRSLLTFNKNIFFSVFVYIFKITNLNKSEEFTFQVGQIKL